MKNTQAKHTIGDWQRDGEDIFISEDENNCTPICTLETDCVSVDEMEANGNLIRSVPMLLEALKTLHSCAKSLDQSATHDGLENCKALAKAFNAIQKAESKL